MPRRIYANPPIDEATCQFTPADAFPWDDNTPSRLFEQLRQHYPGMPAQQQLLQANLAVAPAGAAPSNLLLSNSNRIVFTDEEGINRLSVSPVTISVHRTRPYAGFKHELLERIRRDVPEIMRLLRHEDAFKAVSVRYVNRIVIPEKTVGLSEYFTHWGATSVLPTPFNGHVSGFFYRTAAERSDEPENLTLTFGSLNASDDESAFVLDMDLTHTFGEPVSSEQAIQQMISIQASTNAIFESLITDKCRELFG